METDENRTPFWGSIFLTFLRVALTVRWTGAKIVREYRIL